MKSDKQIIKTHRETLENALQLLKPRGPQQEICFCGKLIDLSVGFKLEDDYPQRFQDEPYIFASIAHDLWNIATLAHRLDWMKTIASSDPIFHDLWRPYSSLDIEHLYVEFRSLCDHLASLIWCCFEEVPDNKAKSFYKLLVWLWKNQIKCDKTLVSVVENAGLLKPENQLYRTWFGHMREIRDEINHRGANTFVFGTPNEGIIFQVLRDYLRQAIPALPHLKFNENVLFFDKYFALQMSNLLVFSEKLSEVIMKKLDISAKDASCSGFNTIHLWISNFYGELKEYE